MVKSKRQTLIPQISTKVKGEGQGRSKQIKAKDIFNAEFAEKAKENYGQSGVKDKEK